MDSEAVFTAALKTLQLGDLKSRFDSEGWKCFNDFAFCTPDFTGRDTAAFEGVVDGFLKPEEKSLKPRMRQLYAKAFAGASAAMAEEVSGKDQLARVSMHHQERAARTEQLKLAITGFVMEGPNLPGHGLIDRFHTIHEKGVVRYVKWELSISRAQEVSEEPEIRGLRIGNNGSLIQDTEPDPRTDVSGELLWDFAMRRRALAAHISGLIRFATKNGWSETLKKYLMMTPPDGYRRVSWAQLRAADQALYSYVAVRCEAGTKANIGEHLTEFEKHFIEGTKSPEILQFLAFLQGSGSSGSDGRDANSLKLQLHAIQQQLGNLKRKAPDADAGGPGRGKHATKNLRRRTFLKEKKAAKGKGGGKGKAPAHWNGLPTTTPAPENKRICFAFNDRGCPLAKPGEECVKGKHVCPKCQGPHSIRNCVA